MPNKARKEEKFEARKQEECPEQKSQQIKERDARKCPEELANANMKMQEASTRKYVDASPEKMCEMMRTPQRNDAGRSATRTRCTDRSA